MAVNYEACDQDANKAAKAQSEDEFSVYIHTCMSAQKYVYGCLLDIVKSLSNKMGTKRTKAPNFLLNSFGTKNQNVGRSHLRIFVMINYMDF